MMNVFRATLPLIWANSSKIEKKTFCLLVVQALTVNLNEIVNLALISSLGAVVTSGSPPEIYNKINTFLSNNHIFNIIIISPYRFILLAMAFSFAIYGINLVSFNRNKSLFASYWCHERIKEKTSQFFNEDYLPHKNSNVNNLLNKLLIDAFNVSAMLIQPVFVAINALLLIILSGIYWLIIFPVTTSMIIISLALPIYTIVSIFNNRIRTISKKIRVLRDAAVNKIVDTENLFGEIKIYGLLQSQIDEVVRIDAQLAKAIAMQGYIKIVPGVIIQIMVICSFVLLLLFTTNPISLVNNAGYLLAAFYTVFKLVPTMQSVSRCLGSFAAGHINLVNLLSSDFTKVKLYKE